MATPAERFRVTQEVTRPLSPRLMDMCLFVDFLERLGYIVRSAPSKGAGELTDVKLASLAEDFWDNQHGEN